MSEADNTRIVKDAYAAFARGAIGEILNLLDDNVEWEAVKGAEGVAPYAGLRQGRPAIAEFFQLVDQYVKFDAFEPREFVAQGDQVVAIGRYSGSVNPTRRPFASDWVMVFTVRNGKVVRFREFADSAQLVNAFAVGAERSAV